MLKNGVFEFEPQWVKDKNDRTRFSRLYIRLVEAPGKITNSNWEFDDEKSIPITADLLPFDLQSGKMREDFVRLPPIGYVGALWSETGIEGMKTLRSVPTYISEGKNLGKKNATNYLTQTIAEGQSKHNKNTKKSGYVSNKNDISGDKKILISPMALHSLPTQDKLKPFDLSDTKLWKEGDRVFVGRKIDGNRMMATIIDGELVLFGRSGAVPRNPLKHIRDQLMLLFKSNKDVIPILDGEIYKHGMPHQLINGLYMNETADSSMLDYVLFDIVVLDKSGTMDTLGKYEDRYKYLINYVNSVSKKYIPNIYINEEKEASTTKEIEQIYRSYLRDGYEGAVIRHADGLYEIGTTTERRSKRALKLKPVFDSEFEIVGYEDGKGRDKGGIIWILKTKNGKIFKARPADTIEMRREIFEKMKTEFNKNYLGKMMTVVYTDTTKDGTPRFPRAKSIR